MSVKQLLTEEELAVAFNGTWIDQTPPLDGLWLREVFPDSPWSAPGTIATVDADRASLASEPLPTASLPRLVGTMPNESGSVEDRAEHQADPFGPDPDVHEWLAAPEPEFDFLIPGLLERGDRLMLTGGEGHGKTTLCRQFAVKAAAGIDPFTEDIIDPVRTMFADFENGERFSKRQFKPMVTKARPRLKGGMLRMLPLPGGMDLLTEEDRRWFRERVQVNEPELLIVGPLYKMYAGNPNDEEPARVVARFFDEIRTETGCAIIIEAHTGHGPELRPYGASMWKRWPEFGLALTPTGSLVHWRGARDERSWPRVLKRGGGWPWVVDQDPDAERWQTILEATQSLDEKPSLREIEQITRISKSAVSRILKRHETAWNDRWA